VGRQRKFGWISAVKIGARLASPQPRPAIAGQWGRGITGCEEDAQAKGSFQTRVRFFSDFVIATFFRTASLRGCDCNGFTLSRHRQIVCRIGDRDFQPTRRRKKSQH